MSEEVLYVEASINGTSYVMVNLALWEHTMDRLDRLEKIVAEIRKALLGNGKEKED